MIGSVSMSSRRPSVIGASVAVAVATVLILGGCSSSKKDGSSTSTTTSGSSSGSAITSVLPPYVLTPSNNTVTVKIGAVVTFDMGEPQGGGTFVATSDNTNVFVVDSVGRTEGSATFNAGGKAVGSGVANVVVQFKGSTNGLGTPTKFVITVQ
jgi:hypothetical protein